MKGYKLYFFENGNTQYPKMKACFFDSVREYKAYIKARELKAFCVVNLNLHKRKEETPLFTELKKLRDFNLNYKYPYMDRVAL